MESMPKSYWLSMYKDFVHNVCSGRQLKVRILAYTDMLKDYTKV